MQIGVLTNVCNSMSYIYLMQKCFCKVFTFPLIKMDLTIVMRMHDSFFYSNKDVKIYWKLTFYKNTKVLFYIHESYIVI